MTMFEREAQTREAFTRYDKRREIAVATLRNIAREAEERAAFCPPGTADRMALNDYADELWRAYTHATRAADTSALFASATNFQGAA